MQQYSPHCNIRSVGFQSKRLIPARILEHHLLRQLDQDRTRRVICRGIVQVCRELGMEVIAEGIETRDEMLCLQDLGVYLFGSSGFCVGEGWS